MHRPIRHDGERRLDGLVQPASQRIARCCRAVRVGLVELGTGLHAVGHVLILKEWVVGRVLGISGQGGIQRAACCDFERAEAGADVAAAAKSGGGRDEITTRACVRAVRGRRSLRGRSCMIDTAPQCVARHVSDRARSDGERLTCGVAGGAIGVLGVRVGAVDLDLGAVGRAFEGGRRIGCRVDRVRRHSIRRAWKVARRDQHQQDRDTSRHCHAQFSLNIEHEHRIDRRCIVTVATHQANRDKEGSLRRK